MDDKTIDHQADFDAPPSPDQAAAVEAFRAQDFSPGGPGDGTDAAAIAQAVWDHAGGDGGKGGKP